MAEKKLSQFRISNDTYDIYDKEAQDCLTDTNLINDSLNLNGNAIINGEFKIKPTNNVTAFSVVGDGELQDTIYKETTYLIPFIFNEDSERWVADLLRPLSDNNTDEEIIDFTWYSGSQKLNFTEGRYQENEWWEFTSNSERSFQLQVEDRDQENNIISLSLYLGNNESELFPNGEPKVKIFGKFVQYKYDSSKIQTNSGIYIEGANKNNLVFRDSTTNGAYDGNTTTGNNASRVATLIDSDNQTISRLLLRQAPATSTLASRHIASLESHGYNSDNGHVWNRLSSIVDSKGNSSYEVSNPAAFRKAIEIDQIGSIREVNGGTLETPRTVPSETYTSLAKLTLEAGVWIVFCHIEYSTSTAGRRTGYLSVGSAGGGDTIRSAGVAPAAGGPTRVKFGCIVHPNASTDYYLTAWHNAQTDLSTKGVAQAVRIK